MKEIIDIKQDSEIVRDYISRYGFMPEHNFEYFKCLTDEGQPAFYYEDDFGVMCFISDEGKSKVVRSLVEPLAKQDNILNALQKFVKYCLDVKHFDKIVLETRHEIKLELEKVFKKSEYKVLKDRYHLTWPVFIMKNFDESLSGGNWKKMRYFKNKFFKDQNPDVGDFQESDKNELKELVKVWAKTRTASDIAHYHRYINFIDNNFKGFDMVKIIKINGKPVSFFGGWRIVNSGNYYSCIGIYDYSYENIGEVSNLIDLTEIKKMGVEKADLGGGEEALTNFKKKFFPDEFYRTDIYTVKKK